MALIIGYLEDGAIRRYGSPRQNFHHIALLEESGIDLRLGCKGLPLVIELDLCHTVPHTSPTHEHHTQRTGQVQHQAWCEYSQYTF